MKFSAPTFWNSKTHPAALALWPLGEIYKLITAMRMKNARPPRADIPVVCIGNATAGGVGKTPVVQDIVQRLLAAGQRPHILLRGYGGRIRESTRVDPTVHDAVDVGDEALLHAAIAPTWVGADRLASANAAARDGATIAIMDDGLQNISVAPTTRWLVVDGARGMGNGYGIPAGPLRESFRHAIERVDAVIIMGQGSFVPRTDKPTLRAAIATQSNSDLKDHLIYCFAGIGQPEKLRSGLMAAGYDVVGARAFPDHHVYTPEQISALHTRAKLLGATLVTTQKDFMRLPENLRKGIVAVDVKVSWDNEVLLNNLLIGMMHA